MADKRISVLAIIISLGLLALFYWLYTQQKVQAQSTGTGATSTGQPTGYATPGGGGTGSIPTVPLSTGGTSSTTGTSSSTGVSTGTSTGTSSTTNTSAPTEEILVATTDVATGTEVPASFTVNGQLVANTTAGRATLYEPAGNYTIALASIPAGYQLSANNPSSNTYSAQTVTVQSGNAGNGYAQVIFYLEKIGAGTPK